MVEATVVETLIESACRKATSLNTRHTRGTDRSRAREAAAKVTATNGGCAKSTTAAEAAAKTTPMPAAAVSTAEAAAAARQGYVWRQHAD
ncbi:MAG: hypothetical protein ACXWKP_17975 [Bradyrhizobium sp.]